jgi:putative endonuclease
MVRTMRTDVQNEVDGVEPESAAVASTPPTASLWWLYLLQCADGRTYAGIALDVAARFRQHRNGKGAKFTRANPPTRILAAQSFASKGEALRAEHALKRLRHSARLVWAAEWRWTAAQQVDE